MPPAAALAKPTVLGLAEDMAAGRTSSRALIEAALARIAEPSGEGARSFVRVYADNARRRRRRPGPLARGRVTSPRRSPACRCRSRTSSMSRASRRWPARQRLDDRPPAERDAPVVARLRAAGAVLIGRTNMTEFAFSGVGINPHYGTPGNPHDRRPHSGRLRPRGPRFRSATRRPSSRSAVIPAARCAYPAAL